MRRRLAIFDWDGTLCDSAAVITEAMQEAIAALGLPPRDDEQIRVLIGLGLDDVFRRLYPEIPLDALRGMFERYRRSWLARTAHREPPLFPGALEAVAALAEQGWTIAVATGKSRAGLDRALSWHAELARLVSHSRCADETAPKPDPRMLRELIAETGIPPQGALMIGDTSYDMRMAATVGVPAVGVACGVHAPQALREAGAGAVLETVAQLPDWLAGEGARLTAAPARSDAAAAPRR